MEFQQTERGEMNRLGSEKRPFEGMNIGEHRGLWEHQVRCLWGCGRKSGQKGRWGPG